MLCGVLKCSLNVSMDGTVTANSQVSTDISVHTATLSKSG